MNILGILIAGLLAQQPRLASVEGIVLRAGTSQPIAKAVVELSGNSASESLAMATGADGKFEFRNLAPGRYRLAVSRSGYLDSAYGQRGPYGSGTALEIGAGQTLRDIRLTMVASAAISGRVQDTSGEPLANVPVQALKYSYLDGQRTLTPVKTDMTDDRGEYRLFWLPPGMYYVSAVPQAPGPGESIVMSVMSGGAAPRAMRADSSTGRILTDGQSEAEKLGEADVPVYYPGTTDPQAAVPVEARPGADIGGVDFSLARVKTRKVSGIVVDGVSGQPVTSAAVTLVPRYPSIAGSYFSRRPAGGGFEIQGVLPGSYFLVATYRAPAGKDAVRIMGGRIPVEVGGSDLDRLTLILSLALDIRGEVTVEGRPGGADDHHPIVSLKNEVGAAGRPAQTYGSFSDNKQFVINDVIEGDYQVHLSDLPKGAYVKSIRFGATDALNNSLQIDPRSSERLEIVLSMNAGVIEGTVLNRNREPLSNAPVALVPDAARRQRGDLYRSTYTDDRGRFQLHAIPPGVYSIFAWEDIEDGLWRDPEFIRRNEASGKIIRIVEGSRETVDLTALPFDF
jgi:hypothetical protein